MTQPTRRIVIDTSVVVKRFLHKEADSAQAPLLREQRAREEISLCAPQLLVWEVAYEHDVTVYDATFVALAQELQCPFVTADARLVGKIGPTNAQLLSHL